MFVVGKNLKCLFKKNILKSLAGEENLACRKIFFYTTKNHSAWAENKKHNL